MCIYTLGSRFIEPAGMVALGLTYSWHGDMQTVLPALAAQRFRLRDPMARRHYTGIVLGTVVASLKPV